MQTRVSQQAAAKWQSSYTWLALLSMMTFGVLLATLISATES